VDCGPGLVVDVPQLRSQGGNVAVTACIAQRCQTERFIGVNGKLGDAPVYVPLPDDDVARVTLVVHDSAGRMLYRAAGTLPITEYDADACVHCRHIRARGDGNALVTRPE
jgi:hypothetical protein